MDKENHTQIAMQAMLSNERTDDFVFLFRAFKELCGAQPEVSRSPFCSEQVPLSMRSSDASHPWTTRDSTTS